MTAHQSPTLPVLPTVKRRRGAAVRAMASGVAIQQPAFPRTRSLSRTAYRHFGVVALCLSAVGLVGTLVTFSIIRDLAALNRPVEPAITAPLRP
jgi:hypothetical protein